MKVVGSMKKIVIKIIIILFILAAIAVGGYFYYDKVYLEKKAVPKISLNGEETITINLNDNYEELGAKASYRDNDVTKSIKIHGDVDNTKVDTYKITYEINVKGKKKSIARTIKVVDTIAPEMTLKGDAEKKFVIGNEYKDEGCTAIDNYDGDITDKIEVTSNVDFNTPGEYEIKYAVVDSSGNASELKRKVTYVKPYKKPLPNENATATSIAVLNYHFLCDPNKGEYCGDGNFMTVQSFEEQLIYLRDNHYKTLTIEEFRAWMYGEIQLPARSVLITFDDGASGTGFQNGNKLIPLLEKYNMHATLFLISGWWQKSNYESPNLDVESHSYDMHTSNYCNGVSRGAKMLCLSNEEVLRDLKSSISALGGRSTAFCFPFYAYSDNAINLVKEAGFKMAFIGGERKATRYDNKYMIPRYHMYKWHSIIDFNNFIA